MPPHQLNNMNRMRIRIPKSWILLAVFIVSVIGAGAWVFTTPPNGLTNQTGSFFGNTSNNANNYTADQFNAMNWFGVIVGSYVDSYSCDASYCIYQPWYDSSKIYAKNVSTGKIDYRGTDAYTVIQSANNIASTNILDGTYLFSTPLNPVHDITGTSRNNTILKVNGVNIGVIDTGISTTKNVKISNLMFEGNGDNFISNQPIIRIMYPDNVKIDGNVVVNSSQDAISFGGANVAFAYNSIHDSNGSAITNNIIKRTSINFDGKGITVIRNDNVLVAGNDINDTYLGIHIVESYYNTISENKVSYIKNSGGGGIWLSYASSHSFVYGNKVEESLNAAYSASAALGLCIVFPTSVNACPSTRNISIDNVFTNNIARNTLTGLSSNGITGRTGGVVVRNNVFDGQTNGIKFFGTNTTNNLTIVDQAKANLGNLIIENNKITGSSGKGIIIDSYDSQTNSAPINVTHNNIFIRGNAVDTSASTGIFGNFSNSSFQKLYIEQNWVNKSGTNGISIFTDNGSLGQDVYISNNNINDTNGRGIRIEAFGGIDNININYNSVFASSSTPINVIRNVSNVSINYNIIQGNPSGAIAIDRVFAGATANVSSVKGNTIVGTSSGGIAFVNVANTNYQAIDNYPISPIDYGNRASCTAITSVGIGDRCYNTTSKAFNVFNGGTWQYYNGTYVNAY